VLAPNERPQLLTGIAPMTKEPDSGYFELWVDAYDLVNCDEAKGKTVRISSSIGSYHSSKLEGKFRDKTQAHEWKKNQLKALRVNFPKDLKQNPDIIINIYYDSTFTKDYRVGYIRIPAKNCSRKFSKPQWYRLRSPYNDNQCPGIILMNIQYVSE
jgi:hypothetical protein